MNNYVVGYSTCSVSNLLEQSSDYFSLNCAVSNLLVHSSDSSSLINSDDVACPTSDYSHKESKRQSCHSMFSTGTVQTVDRNIDEEQIKSVRRHDGVDDNVDIISEALSAFPCGELNYNHDLSQGDTNSFPTISEVTTEVTNIYDDDLIASVTSPINTKLTPFSISDHHVLKHKSASQNSLFDYDYNMDKLNTATNAFISKNSSSSIISLKAKKSKLKRLHVQSCMHKLVIPRPVIDCEPPISVSITVDGLVSHFWLSPSTVNDILLNASRFMNLFSSDGFKFDTRLFISDLLFLANTFNRPFAIAESIEFNKDFKWPSEALEKDISLLRKLGSVEKVAESYLMEARPNSFNLEKVNQVFLNDPEYDLLCNI
jgi:hypothetical protein